MSKKKKIIKSDIQEGFTAWGKSGEFNDYDRIFDSKSIGEDNLHPLIVNSINNDYVVVSFGTTTPNRITDIIEVGNIKIKINAFNTYIFSIDTTIEQMETAIGVADTNSDEFVKMRRHARNKGRNRKLISQILNEIKDHHYDAADQLIDKQFEIPSEEDIRDKQAYKDSRVLPSRKQRIEFLREKGVDLNRFSDKERINRKANRGSNSSNDDEPSD